MEVSDLTRSALNPDILSMVDSSHDTSKSSRMYQLMLWVPLEDADKLSGELTRVFADDDNVPPPSTATDASVAVVKGVLLDQYQKNPQVTRGRIGVATLLDIVWQSCRKVLRAQVTALYGTRTADRKVLPDSMWTFLDTRLSGITDQLNAAIPFRDDDTGFFVQDLKAHLAKARTVIDAFPIEPALRDWLFTPPVMDAIFYLFHPWLYFKFVASFVPGAWNAANQDRVSFYDMRYAELALYRMMLDTNAQLRSLLLASGGATDNELYMLEQLSFKLNDSVANRFTKPEYAKMKHMYSQIARLSKHTKDESGHLYELDQRVHQRKDNLHVVLHNMRRDTTQQSRGRAYLALAIVVYIAITAGMVALVVLGRYTLLYMAAGGVLLVVLVLWLVSLLRQWVR